MTDPLAELIKEIAVKHGVAVGRDDPILILQTLNKRLMEDNTKAQQHLLDRFKEELEDLARRWGEDSKTRAERILNASLTAGKETMAIAVQEMTQTAAASMEREMENVLAHIHTPLSSLRYLAGMMILASFISLAVACVLLWRVSL